MRRCVWASIGLYFRARYPLLYLPLVGQTFSFVFLPEAGRWGQCSQILVVVCPDHHYPGLDFLYCRHSLQMPTRF